MTLCGFEIAPGEKQQVKLPVPGGVPLEAWLLCGAHPGKTLVVTAGVHGCEYVGILALQKLVETLDCATLYGQVILLPLVNPKGFFAGVKQLNPADGRNLNREFPGKEDGTETQRMAWTIEKLLYPEADFLLDLHGGDWNEELAPLVFFPCGAGQKVEQETRRAAQALSVSMRVCSTARNGSYSWAAQKGIPALLLERGGNGRWTPEEVEADCEDVLRLMNHLGIRKEAFDAVPQTEIAKAVYDEALEDGYWFPEVCAGQEVLKDALLGRWKSSDGTQSCEVRARFAGRILYETTALGVRRNDPLVAYGTA